MNRAARALACAVLGVGLSTAAGAQTFSSVLTTQQIEERVHFDGNTLVHNTRGVRGFTQTETVDVSQLDLTGTMVQRGIVAADGSVMSIEQATTPASVSALTLKCKDNKPCVSVNAQFDGSSDVGRQALASNEREISVRCPKEECGRLLALVKAVCDGCTLKDAPKREAPQPPKIPDRIDFPKPQPSASPLPSPRPSPSPQPSEQEPENLIGTEWRGQLTGEFNGRRGLWTETDAIVSFALRDRGYAISEYSQRSESARWTQLPGARVEMTTTIPVLNCTGTLTIRATVVNGAMQGRFTVDAGACGTARGTWSAERTR